LEPGPRSGSAEPTCRRGVILVRMAFNVASEELRELPIDPLYFGIGTFAILLVLLVGLLMFGKGRPHS